MDLLEKLKEHHLEQYTHSKRVSILCVLIGFKLGLSLEQLNELDTIGLYHDIGKIKIPIEILGKKGKLTQQEYTLIKLHSLYSSMLIKNESKTIREAVLYHHENLDGSGYFHIKGDHLNIYQRILHVADVYEALTAERCYKKPWSKEEAYQYMADHIDTMFDKQIVETLKDIIF
ncbi:MAG: HD domain-containing protein [Acutalibacteraceae bacterium]|nr:HD domain-containing protein [Acutalibacteraceae bacterium]